MKRTLNCVLMILLADLTAVAATNDVVPVACSTNAVNAADWGPAYVPGMEHGPASKELSGATQNAETFISRQAFANQYAKRACSAGGFRWVEVAFALLADKTGRTHGVVRVDMMTGECSWLGNKMQEPNKASDATSKPAPGAGSSAHQR